MAREVLCISDTYEEDHTDVRVTAFYRSENRGGILVRVRRSTDEPADPFLHLVVVPHNCDHKLVVFEWVAPETSVPPTDLLADLQETVMFNKDAVVSVVEHLFRQVRTHLMRVRQARR
jgi:hypothetical protein